MTTSPDWGLRLRMVVSLFLLAAFTLVFLTGLWVAMTILSLFVVEPGSAPGAGVVLTLLLVGGIAYAEYEGGTVEGRADAVPIDREDYPELYAVVTNVAAELDVPVPKIAIADRETPEAMVVGLRPSSTHLVISNGLLAALDREEIEAVIAHELAHVANRDAMVMTVVSIPAMVAEGLRSRLLGLLRPSSRRRSAGESSEYGSTRSSGWRRWFRPRIRIGSARSLRGTLFAILVLVLLKLALITFSTVAWVTSRTIVAVLSRARETAADRTAARTTGSPDVLAAALYELDERIGSTPRHDLREVSDVSALSICSLEPRTVEPLRLGPEGDREPFLWSVRKPLLQAKKRLFRTHPDTDERIDALSELAREEE